ncbi:hypothetical protein [Micromonospora maritima]|uniref:hypothetical protein n=1 Tax=Micromonospora maritima TaxID=986711 RepID=UPI0037B78A5E
MADLVEESRAKGRQRARRRSDRRWLRHVVTILLHPDVAVDDAWHARQLAALPPGRVDARIVTSNDVHPVRAAVTSVVGRKRLRRLRDIWREAHTCDNTDAGHHDLPGPAVVSGSRHRPRPAVPHTLPDAGLLTGCLAAALVDYLVATGVTPADYAATLPAQRHSPPPQWDRIDSTEQEHRAARDLANRLRQARTGHPYPGRRPSTIPSDRLRTHHAITAEAQTAAGQLPTAALRQQRAHNCRPRNPARTWRSWSTCAGQCPATCRRCPRPCGSCQRAAPRRSPPSGFGDRAPSWCPPAMRALRWCWRFRSPSIAAPALLACGSVKHEGHIRVTLVILTATIQHVVGRERERPEQCFTGPEGGESNTST